MREASARICQAHIERGCGTCPIQAACRMFKAAEKAFEAEAANELRLIPEGRALAAQTGLTATAFFPANRTGRAVPETQMTDDLSDLFGPEMR